MSEQPRFSIIIPAYNEAAYLPATLASVKEAIAGVDKTGEIIVTDNNSTDETAAIAEAAGVKVVFEEHQQIARSRNAGAAAARGDYLIFLDADTLLNKETLQATFDALDEGYCGGGTFFYNRDEDPKAFKRAISIWNFIARTTGWTAGAYIFCLREAFVSFGGYSEKVYAGEDVLFGMALKRWGRRHKKKTCLVRPGVYTSSRKIGWYSPMRTLWLIIKFFIFPWRLLSRKGCEFWYQRPEEKDK